MAEFAEIISSPTKKGSGFRLPGFMKNSSALPMSVFVVVFAFIGVYLIWNGFAATVETEVAKGKPATSSSVENSSLGPQFGNDGNTTTRWSSQFSNNQWWQVDLGASTPIDRVDINWQHSYATHYYIQTSQDGINYTNVADVHATAPGIKSTTFSLTSARYVRIFGLTRSTQYGFSIWEAQVFSPITEYAKGKPATSSSVENSSLGPQLGNDGNTTTRWSSQFSNNQWWQVDLGSAVTVNRMDILWQNSFATHYYIQTSTDGTNFTTAADVSDTTSGLKSTSFTPVSARYVRVFGLTRSTQYGFSIWEAQVYGPVQGSGGTGGSPPPTISLSALPTSVAAGQSSTITWSSMNATSCTAGGNWTGIKPTSGSISTGALNATSNYQLTCTGAGGSASATTSVTVTGGGTGGGGSGPGIVSANPAGPTSPSGAWKPVLADGFGTSLGTSAGQDNFWYPNQNSSNPCTYFHGNNSNELQVYHCSQVSVDSQGLHLTAQYQPNAGGTGKNYVSGTVQDFNKYAAVGYKPFAFHLGQGGSTLVFELNAKLPVNTGEMDPGWWTISDTRWPPELDFFEEWGWGTCYKPGTTNPNAGCLTGVTYIEPGNSLIQAYHSLYTITPPTDPSAGYHKYTTVVGPNGIQEYIDGVLQSWVNLHPAWQTDEMSLILTNALRSNTSSTSPGFTSGTRTFDIRSVAVYEDSAHAGQYVSGGGIAPGTTVK